MRIYKNTLLNKYEIIHVISENRCVKLYSSNSPSNPFTLEDCLKAVEHQPGRGQVLVIAENSYEGVLYRYGARGEQWELAGKTYGFDNMKQGS